MAKYTSADILKCLDAQNIDCGFPAFSNFKINMVTARLRGFRSQTTWVILFEQLVNCYAAEGIQPILLRGCLKSWQLSKKKLSGRKLLISKDNSTTERL